MDSEPSQLPDRKARKSVAFTEEKLVVDADGKVTTMSTPNEEKDTAQSHTPRTPPLSAALGAFTDASSAPADVTLDGAAPDDDGLDLTLKKKKKKPKKVEDGEEAAGDENAEDGGLDLTLKKKKKKKPIDDDEFAKKLKAMELNDKEAEEGDAEPEEPEVEEGDMDEGTGIWAHDATESIPYKMLLGRFYKLLEEKNPDHATSGTRSYKIPPPQCAREGNKKTIFINLADICKRMKRTEEHVTQYLFAELGTSGSTDGSRRLVIKGRFQQKQLENVLRKYIIEYVTCKTCRSPNTELNKGENRLYFITCNSCGSRRSVTAIKTGFSAQIGKRKKMLKG
ncbi:eukaryotic translation initiation factor 2 subunit beta [Pyricularia oryzae]|nr:eukaryotic translation initiation factor 2 subunit beta [Pyricularia oryzae]